MPINMQYVCDRCEATQDTAEQMWDVAISCEAINAYRSQYHSPNKYQKVMWCRKCVDAMGILTPLIRAITPEQPVTIDDMIREIVQQSIQETRE